MIEIKVTGNTPLEALASLTAFGLHCRSNEAVTAAANRILEAERSKETKMAAAPANSQTIQNLTSTPGPAVPDPAPVTPTPVPVGGPTRFPAPATTAPMGGPPTAPIDPVPAAPPVVPTAPAPGFTVDQVGTAGADMIRDNPAKMSELLALLQQFGVQAITELTPDKLGPFATALRGLGAKI